jgi:hypothetical protein
MAFELPVSGNGTCVTGAGIEERNAMRLACAWIAVIVCAACGGSGSGGGAATAGAQTSAQATSGAGGIDPSGSGSGGDANATVGSGGVGGGSGQGGSTAAAGGGGGSAMGLADVGTLVVLGDSIGDGGGQGPYYYDLLKTSLEGFYGHAVKYQNKAESGSKTGALVGQIGNLPKTLVGPVAVAITSGGNDMKDSLVQILSGTDGPARMQMGSNIDAALKALVAPNKFGAGVKVHVYYANIYDASDGKGNFKDGGCVIKLNSPGPVDGYFKNWNGEISSRVTGNSQTLADLHDKFFNHGFNHPPNWYASDCTHPNTTGHGKVRDLFFKHITGKASP